MLGVGNEPLVEDRVDEGDATPIGCRLMRARAVGERGSDGGNRHGLRHVLEIGMDDEHVTFASERLGADDGLACEQVRRNLEDDLDRPLGAFRYESGGGGHAERLSGFTFVERALDAVALTGPESTEGDGIYKRNRLVRRAHH